MRIVVLADTHIADGTARRSLDHRLLRAADDADMVLHAGDVTGPALLAELGGLAPTVAVLGNNDLALRDDLPGSVELELEGVRIAMVHDSGQRARRGERLAEWYPDADLVVFGHSHQPEDELGPGGQRRFNPGSPTQRRRAPWRSYGLLEVADGRIASLRHVPLD